MHENKKIYYPKGTIHVVKFIFNSTQLNETERIAAFDTAVISIDCMANVYVCVTSERSDIDNSFLT